MPKTQTFLAAAFTLAMVVLSPSMSFKLGPAEFTRLLRYRCGRDGIRRHHLI
jgi:hypothetical protein